MLLLDTHVVLWLALEPARISRRAGAAIQSARQNSEGLALCDISLLEITTLHRKGRIRLDAGLEGFLSEIEARFSVVPISPRVCVRAVSLPASYPSDPADRVIGATALVEGIPLVTADGAIRRNKTIPTIW
jgi:PIN domain nuclease of toxin-antitoxin system